MDYDLALRKVLNKGFSYGVGFILESLRADFVSRCIPSQRKIILNTIQTLIKYLLLLVMSLVITLMAIMVSATTHLLVPCRQKLRRITTVLT